MIQIKWHVREKILPSCLTDIKKWTRGHTSPGFGSSPWELHECWKQDARTGRWFWTRHSAKAKGCQKQRKYFVLMVTPN